MALDPKVTSWLNTQKFTADQEITAFQRLRSKYLPPKGIKTWGEWYELHNITPPKPKPESKTKSGSTEQGIVDRLQKELDAAQSAYERFVANNRDKKTAIQGNVRAAENQLSSAERSRNTEKYNEANKSLKKFQSQLDSLEAEENKLLSNLNKTRDIYNTERELNVTERDIKFRKETNQSVSTTEEQKVEDLKRKRDDLRGQTAQPTTPSSGPPEVRGGSPIPGTGGAVTPSVQTPSEPTETTEPKIPTGETDVPRGAGRTDGTERTGSIVDKKKKTGKGKEEVPVETIESVLEAAKGKYGGIDEVFRTNTELKALLRRAIGDVGDVTDDYEPERFLSELENTDWWKENAGPIRQRGFYKRQYDDLVKTLKTDDPNYETALAELNRTSEYGRGLSSTLATVKNTARVQGSQLDDETATIIAKNLYDYANEGDATKIREAVLGAGKFGIGGIYTGAAGNNIRTLREIARANGLDFDTQFATSKDTWLSKIAEGESIETFKDLIRKSAQNAWAVDDRTRALLDQGVDLETIYSPFKKYMSTILELPEEKITLNDLASKGVIGGEKPMNLYDFRKALRQDERWQYTENARTEMSNLTEGLLRDFGFVR
jgi:hypothetical protein